MKWLTAAELDEDGFYWLYQEPMSGPSDHPCLHDVVAFTKGPSGRWVDFTNAPSERASSLLTGLFFGPLVSPHIQG